MSKENTAKHVTLTNAQTFVTEHTELSTDIENFPLASTTLDGILINADLALKLIGSTPDVTPADVKGYKSNMSTQVFALDKLAKSVCVQTNNTEMLNSLTFHADYIIKGDTVESVVRAKEIVAFITLNKSLFSNILPNDYLVTNKAIATYDTMKDVPAMTKKNKQSFGLALYVKALKEGRACLKNMQIMIEGRYILSNLDLVKGFRTVIRIFIPGVRHNPVNVALIDPTTGLAVQIGEIQRPAKKGKPKSFNVTKKGVVPFKTHKLGDTEYTAIIPGFKDQKFTVTPTKGKKITITIILTKI